MLGIQRKEIRRFMATYHRNGVAGNGFTLCDFEWRDGNGWKPMRAVVFTEDGNCAVFAQEASLRGMRFRGDDFEPAIREEIAAFEKSHGDVLYGPAA